jgi:hypothetical protein
VAAVAGRKCDFGCGGRVNRERRDGMTPTRRWIRNVTRLLPIDSRAVEEAIQEKLERTYPTDKYPFDILIAYTWVHITDYSGINERQILPMTVDPDKVTPVLEVVERMTTKLKLHKQLTQ